MSKWDLQWEASVPFRHKGVKSDVTIDVYIYMSLHRNELLLAVTKTTNPIHM